MAWTSRFRRIETAVLLGPGGLDITRYVRGAITIDRSTDSTVATGSIPLKHARLPWYASGSWALGPQQVEIWVREIEEDWVRIFRGIAEMPSNAGLWMPTGSLRLVSHSQAWANVPICLMVSPFAGQTRKQLLELAISNAALPVTVTGSWPGGRVITRPVDISGQTLVQILQRWGEIEGGSFRETDGGLELIDLATCWGPGVTPLWDFTRYTAPQETPPSRPVTSWIFSGTEPKLPDDGTTTTVVPDDVGDPTGPRTELTRTVTDGVITQEIEERYDLYTVKGVTNDAETLLLVKRVTTDRVYALNGDSKPTGRLTSKTVKTESYYAPLASTGTGDPNYTFEDGTFHTINLEAFQETGLVTETYTWHDGSCSLATIEVKAKAWAAPLSEAVFSDPTETWTADTTVRSQTEETYQQISRTYASEGTWEPGSDWDSVLSFHFGIGVPPAGKVRYRLEGSERGMQSGTGTQIRRNWEAATAWIESPDRLSHQKWVRTWKGSTAAEFGCADVLGLSVGAEAGMAGVTPVETRDDVPEPLPLPPMESGTSMMYALRPWVTSFVVTTALPEVVQSEELLDAETVAEAERVGRDRTRRAFAVRETLDLPADPRWQLYDPIRFTSSARNCSLRPGWVESLRLSLDPLHGRFNAQVGPALDPFPTVAP